MKICILGTGRAIAITHLLEHNDHSITFIGRDNNQLNELRLNKTNSKYTDHHLKKNHNTLNLDEADFNNFELIFYCLPSKNIDILSNLNNNIPVVITSKGFKDLFIFERFKNYVILSGGSYSSEILKNIPCYITLGSNYSELNKIVKKLLLSKYCLISLNSNPKSIELLGIFKNIIAMFCGIISQLNMGKNIEAAFISKILNRLSDIINFDKTTIIEPAGIGDLFLSCSSTKSRNYSFGINLVINRSDNFEYLTEGYNSLINLKEKNIRIIDELFNIIQQIKLNKMDCVKILIIKMIQNDI